MATTFFAWTFPVDRDDVHTGLRSLDDVAPLMKANAEAGAPLMSASRNDWLAHMLARRVGPACGTGALSFLGEVVSVLGGKEIDDAIASITRIMDLAESNPGLVAGAIGGSNNSEILATLKKSKPASDPLYGPEGEEEGDGPLYLFSYLKSLLKILAFAKSHDLVVIHVRYERR